MGLNRLMRSLEWRWLMARVGDLGPKSKAQLGQDLWAVAATRRKRGGYFVEIGAFDGIRHSNTYLLEKEFGWRGILVEPNPACQEDLRRHRSAVISSKAIYSKRTTLDFACIDKEPELSTVVEHALEDRHAEERRRQSHVIPVSAITLNELLEEHSAPDDVDYLSIYTEGSELEILSAFDFARRRIGLLSVEHNNTQSESAVERILLEAGYRRVFRRVSRFDAWYKRVG
jgi:FkbM family methyltransferase